MAINKVEYGQKTLIDLTSDTVTKETLVKGTSAHNAAGEQIEGVFDPTEYLKKSGGDAKDVVSTFSSSDTDDSVSEWTSVSVLSSGEKLSSLFNKISTMFRNIRYLYKLIGSTDISELSEDGTITKSLTTLNGKLGDKTLGVITDISSFIGSNYIIPSDGYIRLIPTSTSSPIGLTDIRNNTTLIEAHYITSIFVRKGITLKIDGSGRIGFIPLINK